MSDNPYAGLDREELAAARMGLVASIKANTNRLQFMESEVGRNLVAAKQEDLAGVRQKYAHIDTKVDAEVVVRSLLRLQVYEEMLVKELVWYADAEKINKKLDIDMKKCNNSITALEKVKQSQR